MNKQVLIKLAQVNLAAKHVLRTRAMQKQAGAWDTLLRGTPQNMVLSYTGLPLITEPIGALSGALSNENDLDEIMKKRKHTGVEFLPGVAPYRVNKERRALENTLKDSKNSGNKTLSERLGPWTSMLGTGATGAGLGALVGGGPGAAIGGIGGLGVGGVADLIGWLTAIGSKNRTEEDLKDYYNNSSTLANYLAPGVGSYNALRNLIDADRVINRAEDDPEYREKLKKKKEDKTE